VQGMNEVLAPLYYVFKNDPDQSNAVSSLYVTIWLEKTSVLMVMKQTDHVKTGISKPYEFCFKTVFFILDFLIMISSCNDALTVGL
jgi:hypothetical protein